MIHRLLLIILVLALLVSSCASPWSAGKTRDQAPVPSSTAGAPADPPGQALTPTPTPPADATTAVPDAPGDVSDYGPVIVDFLNAAPGNRQLLRALLESWQAVDTAPGGGGPDFVEADIDDNGQTDVVIALRKKSEGVIQGRIVFITLSKSRYSLAFAHPGKSSPGGDMTVAHITGVRDINADGRKEVIFTWTLCGAHTCSVGAHVIAWDRTEFVDLMAGHPVMATARVSAEDQDSDGVEEIVMRGGAIASAGAGLQRERTEIYGWNGTVYRLKKTIRAPAAYLYFKIQDANEAFEMADYDRAVEIYREAISDGALKLWLGETEGEEAGRRERRELHAFARFRLVLVHLLEKNIQSSQAQAARAAEEDAGTAYGPVTAIAWSTYEETASLAAASKKVTDYARKRPETVEILNRYGYANLDFKVDQIFPPPKPAW